MYPDVKWSILAVEWNWYCFNTFIFSRSIILLWVCQKRFISWWYIFSTFICKSKFFQILHIYISQPFQYAKKKLHLPKYWFPILINMKRSDRMVSFFSNFQLKLKFILSQKMTFSLFPIVGKYNTLVPFDLKTTFYFMDFDVEKMVRFLMNDQIWPLKALFVVFCM